MSLGSRLISAGAFVLAASTLAGCGASSSTSPAPPATPATSPFLASLPANLDVVLTTSQPGSLPNMNVSLGLSGNVISQGSNVSGTLRFSSATLPPCVPTTQDIAYAGSVDTNGLLTLTTAAFAGTVATIKIALPAILTPANLYSASGSAVLTGGSCAATITQTAAFFVPPVSGTYTGMLTPYAGYPTPGGAGGPATLVLTQAEANSDGQFPLTGTLNFTTTNCVIATPVIGTASGVNINLVAGTQILPLSGVNAVSVSGAVAPSGGETVFLNVVLPVQGCSNVGLYNGTLTR